MNKPIYDEQHVVISEADAIDIFHPERLKAEIRTRWQTRPEGSLLAVLSVSKGFMDLCWWNASSKAWTYITTIKTVRNA